MHLHPQGIGVLRWDGDFCSFLEQPDKIKLADPEAFQNPSAKSQAAKRQLRAPAFPEHLLGCSKKIIIIKEGFFPPKPALIMPARRRQECQGSPAAFLSVCAKFLATPSHAERDSRTHSPPVPHPGPSPPKNPATSPKLSTGEPGPLSTPGPVTTLHTHIARAGFLGKEPLSPGRCRRSARPAAG